MIRFVCLFVCLFITSFSSFAAEWTSVGKIKGVYTDTRSDKNRVLFRHTDQRNPDGCQGGDRYELETGTPVSAQAFSHLLTIEARSLNVKIFLDGCSASNWPLAKIVDTIGLN